MTADSSTGVRKRRTGLGLSSAGAWWCFDVALLFHEILFISLASSPTEVLRVRERHVR